MKEIPDFDGDFVREWETNYYKCDEDYRDEQRYQGLIELVKKDIAERDTISKQTLKGILKWKLGPYYGEDGNVDWEKYKITYVPRFRLIISESISDNHKLFILIWDEDKLKDKLPVVSGVLDNIHGKAGGFGVPVASTVLHFIFPDGFPIIDIRTAETLYVVCRIKSPNRYDYRICDQFRQTILGIAGKTGCSLHAIDRALFAYHRDVLQPKIDEIFQTWSAANKPGPEISLTLNAPSKLRRMVLDAMKKDP